MINGKSALLALTALVLVAGCNRGATNNASANNSTTANTAAAAPAAPAAAAGGTLDQAFLVGHWGAAGDCSRTLSFAADGTAMSTGEADPARFTVEGGNIVITPTGQPAQPQPAMRSGDKLVLTGPQGQQLTMTRCPAAAATAPAEAGADEAEKDTE